MLLKTYAGDICYLRSTEELMMEGFILILVVMGMFFLFRSSESNSKSTTVEKNGAGRNDSRSRTVTSALESSASIPSSNVISTAINQKKRITFTYTKTGKKSETRRILPKRFKEYLHGHNHAGGSTTCVSGHCDMRKEDRSFAVHKMSNIKIHD